MAAPRDTARRLCETFLPETDDRDAYAHWTEIGFDHIAKNYAGAGTTCGFLPHWLLWRLGCRDNTLVNRACPDEELTYLDASNLSILLPTRERPRASWVPLITAARTREVASGRGPTTGDFIIIRGRNWKDKDGKRTQDSSHIFVLLDVKRADGKEVVWRVAQCGGTNNARQQAGHITTITGKVVEEAVPEGAEPYMAPGPNIVFHAQIIGEPPNFPRRVIGWTNLDAIGFGATPDASFTALFEQRRNQTTLNDNAKIAEWLGWWALDEPGETYVLLERGHEASLIDYRYGSYACTAGGLWTRSGNTLDIAWDNGTQESWLVSRAWTPKPRTEAKPLGNAPMLQRLVLPPRQAPANLPPKWRFAAAA
jgi:hypothetical protein